MTIDELKQRVLDGSIEPGLFSSKSKIVNIFDKKFIIRTFQDNGWERVNTYEYDEYSETWTESETYTKD